MSAPSDLERRVRILEDIEAIKKLKIKYWNSVDGKQWDDLSACLTPDFIFENPQFGVMEGRDFIVKVLKRAMKGVATAHQGHNPEIEVTGIAAAKGRWALNDYVETQGRGFFRGYGRYEDEYVRENGSWKIKKSKLTYLVQEDLSKSSVNNRT